MPSMGPAEAESRSSMFARRRYLSVAPEVRSAIGRATKWPVPPAPNVRSGSGLTGDAGLLSSGPPPTAGLRRRTRQGGGHVPTQQRHPLSWSRRRNAAARKTGLKLNSVHRNGNPPCRTKPCSTLAVSPRETTEVPRQSSRMTCSPNLHTTLHLTSQFKSPRFGSSVAEIDAADFVVG